MENEEFSDIIGNHDAPFINRLAARSALAGQMYAVSHPSLPNYLALTGGSTFGIASDCTGCSVHASSLVTQLQGAGISWRAYMEGIPHPCFQGGGAGNYAKKHDPFMYYTPISPDPAACAHVVGFRRLAADERAGSLPRFAWITPDLCHDMHDCDTATGDRFLASAVPALLARLGHHGLLVLTWDEGSSDDGCCGLGPRRAHRDHPRRPRGAGGRPHDAGHRPLLSAADDRGSARPSAPAGGRLCLHAITGSAARAALASFARTPSPPLCSAGADARPARARPGATG